MKKITYYKFFSPLFIALFFLMACTSNNNGNTPANATQQDGYVLTPYPSGIGGLQKAIKRSKQGAMEEEGDFKDGKKTGTWVTYNPQKGCPVKIESYLNGTKHGACFEISPDNNMIILKEVYDNGKLEGERFVYNFHVVKEAAQYNNGEINGKRVVYYDNTKIQEIGDFVNGKREGIATWYDEQGNIKLQYEYKNGEQVKDLTPKK